LDKWQSSDFTHFPLVEVKIMIFDAHIHLEKYTDEEIDDILRDPNLMGVLAVSMDFVSSQRTLQLKEKYPKKIFAACGFHPEQPPQAIENLLEWIGLHNDQIDAIGEIGLPYYRRREAMNKGEPWNEAIYHEILLMMLEVAKQLKKPVVLHGVREDVEQILSYLDLYNLNQAHFHWIKASKKTIKKLAERGYYVSFTPDLFYKSEVREIATMYPLERILVETDGPWPFDGPFAGQRTKPHMVSDVIGELAKLRGMKARDLQEIVNRNVMNFLSMA
jgi:TatD DNase family protein